MSKSTVDSDSNDTRQDVKLIDDHASQGLQQLGYKQEFSRVSNQDLYLSYGRTWFSRCLLWAVSGNVSSAVQYVSFAGYTMP